MRKRPVVAAGIALTALAVLAIVWPTRDGDVDPGEHAARAPVTSSAANVSPAAPAATPNAAQPATSATATPATTIAPAEERTVATVRVRGRMPTAVSFRVSGADGAIDDRVRFPGADGTFSIDAMPITRCDIAGFGADTAQWRRHYERPAAEAKLDWDLGVVDAATQRITVDVELHFAKEVLETLLACNREGIVVRMRDQGAGTTPIAEHTFGIAALLHDPSPQLRVATVEVRDAARPVQFTWNAVLRGGKSTWPFPMGLADVVGPQRQVVRLDLLPASVVRGTVKWPDGTPAVDTKLYWSASESRPPQDVVAGASGTFCFVVGANARGEVECDGAAAFGTSHPRSRWPATAGDVLTLQRQPRLRFRVLGTNDRPIDDYQLETISTHGDSGHHENGLGHELLHVLRAFPWVRIYVQPRGGIFTLRVPEEWFASPDRVHDLRLADAMPTGTVEVVAPHANAPPPGFRVQLTLERHDGVSAPRVQDNGPKQWPWLVPHVPAGRYRARFERHGNDGDAEFVIDVTAGNVTRLVVPE